MPETPADTITLAIDILQEEVGDLLGPGLTEYTASRIAREVHQATINDAVERVERERHLIRPENIDKIKEAIRG